MALIGAFFVLANLAIFSFPGAIFWDDWTLFGTPREDIVRHFTEAGLPHAGYINWALTLLGPGGVRVFVFVAGLVSVLLWFKILRITPNISLSSLAVSVALATTFPFFLARVAAINAISVMALVIFLVGWLKFLQGTVSQDRKNSALGLVLVWFSGVLYSAYIPMLLLVALHVALVLSWSLKKVPWKKLIYVTTVLFFAHGVVLLLQRQLYPPHGQYAGYRTILFGENQFILFVAGVGALLAFIFLLFRRINVRSTSAWRRSVEVAMLGLIGFLLAISPYILKGSSFPPYSEWRSRYELNYFIPATLILLAIFVLLETKVSRKVLGALGASVILASIVYSNYLLSRFYVDWQKHSYVTEVLSANRDVIAGKFVVFLDETWGLNAMGRGLRFYEWSGILSDATGAQNTFGLSARDFDSAFSSYLDGEQDRRLNLVYNYRWENHKFPSDGVVVTIRTVGNSSCGLFNFSVRDCLSVDVKSESPSA